MPVIDLCLLKGCHINWNIIWLRNQILSVRGQSCPPDSTDGQDSLCLSSILSDENNFAETSPRRISTLLLVAPVWQSQVWYPGLLELSITRPIWLLKRENLLANPSGVQHPLLVNKPLNLVAWKLSGKNSLIQESQTQLPCLSWTQECQAQTLVTIHPRSSGPAGVLQDRSIHYDAI